MYNIHSSQFDTKLKTFGLVFSSSSSFVEIGCWRNLNLNFFYFLTGQIRDLINQYLIEANSGQYDYVKALAEFSSKDESALTFKKGEIIAVVPKHDAYTEKVSTLKPRYSEQVRQTLFVHYIKQFTMSNVICYLINKV